MAATTITNHWEGWAPAQDSTPAAPSPRWEHRHGWKLIETDNPMFPWVACQPGGKPVKDARGHPRRFKTALAAVKVANAAIVVAGWQESDKEEACAETASTGNAKRPGTSVGSPSHPAPSGPTKR